MVRDRLNELQQKSKEAKKGTKKTDVAVKIDDPLKDVFGLAEDINQSIDAIRKNIEISDRYMKQIIETPYREKDLSEQLTNLFQLNGKLTQNLTIKLKKLEARIKNAGNQSTIGRIELIQYSTLRTRFRECLLKNNESMERFKNFRIKTYKAQLNAKGMKLTDDEFNEILAGDQQIQIFTDNLLIETAEARRLLSEAEELNDQLLKIEKLLQEVRDLFVQMSVLVEEQQELVDVIEYQAQQAVDFVNKTPKLLASAEDKKRKALKRKLTFIGIVALVIIIIGILLVYT